MNMMAWLFTILRNAFCTQRRKCAREVSDSEGVFAARLTCLPDQLDKLTAREVQAALRHLSGHQRQALLLVAEGLSYEEAAISRLK